MSFSKKFFAALISMYVISVLLSSGAMAGSLAVGYVNLQRVFDEYKGAKAMNERLMREKDKRQKELDELQESIKSMKEDYDKEKDSAKRAEMEKAMQKSLGHLQGLYAKLSGELQEQQAKQFKNLEDKVLAAVKRVAEAQGLELVLDRGFVFYGGKDITDEVIEDLNSRMSAEEEKPAKKETKKKEQKGK